MNNKKMFALQLDKQDILGTYKKEFYLLKNKIYMDGNSLGLFSKRSEKALLDVIAAYKELGIDSWIKGNNPFFYFAEKLGTMTAPLIGALSEEVVITGSTTANIHQILATFFKPVGERKKILTDEFAFPTDMYAIKSHLFLHGLDSVSDLVVVKSSNKTIPLEENIIAHMTTDVALIILPVVAYKSGQLLDVKRLTSEAHKRNILIGFDACHSVGIIPHNLHADNVDFAVFCTYKYLNGGPGSPAGLFVNKKHFGTYPGLAGWFGSDKDKQFDMKTNFVPAEGAGAYQMGTPHILSMAPLIGSLNLFEKTGINAIRKKSLALTSYMIELFDKELRDFEFSLETPREASKRGGHIALSHENAASICKALKGNSVVPDFRAPNIIRFAPSPFYTSFVDVYEVIVLLKQIMETQTYKQFINKREVVS